MAGVKFEPRFGLPSDTLEDSPFVFVGTSERHEGRFDATHAFAIGSAVVIVEDVMRVPAGFTGLEGREVRIGLLEPLQPGRYVFFADPWVIGNEILLMERGHIPVRSPVVRDEVVARLEERFAAKVAERAKYAVLIVLATVGPLQILSRRPAEDYDELTWALAPLRIESFVKGSPRAEVVLIGPRVATRELPRAPAVRPGLHALLFLQEPPAAALEHLTEEESARALFIADPADIQPVERRATVEVVLRRSPHERRS